MDDADDLAVGDRILIGTRVSGQVGWRSPQFRLIRFADPETDDDWVERELARRLLRFGSHRRLQLDATTLTQAAKIIPDDSPPSPLAEDPDLDKAIKGADQVRRIVAESTVAAWSGEPMGVPPIEDDQKHSEKRIRVVEELDITRIFSAPSSIEGQQADALAPLLRFGWPYHVALARVFDGGGSISLSDVVTAVNERPGLALPATELGGAVASGRRYLRHERLDAPMSVFPEAHWLALEHALVRSPGTPGPAPQRGADMVVRSSNNPSDRLGSTRRLLLPPPVPLQFAALHDVIDARVRQVPNGLRGMALLDKLGQDAPTRIRFGEGGPGLARDPYYPDPAARLLAISLHQREGDGAGRAFGEPLIVEIAKGAWPTVRPLDLELVAVPSADTGPRVAYLGLGSLAPGDRVVPGPGSVPVQRVQLRLRPGEDIAVQAWFLPSATDLSRWFDAVEAAGLLATAEGTPVDHSDAADACARGLETLLGLQLNGATSIPPAPACTGAGGMIAPPARIRSLLAGRIQAALQSAPIPALTAPLTFRATHATDRASIGEPRIESLTVVRRRFPGGDRPVAQDSAESRLDFLTTHSDGKWGESDSEREATGGLFAGTIVFNPATTGALELEVTCAGPLGEALDQELGRKSADRNSDRWPTDADPSSDKLFGFFVKADHSVMHRRRRVTALRLDGLPLPEDGRSAPRRFSLQELQGAAWGDAQTLGMALRASLPGALPSPGARHLRVRISAVNRHAGLMGEAVKSLTPSSSGDLADTDEDGWSIWLPSTARPAPPAVSHLHVSQIWQSLDPVRGPKGSLTVGVVRATSIRVWLRRPWYSAGEGELLGLVLWPPGLFASGVAKDDHHDALPDAEFRDEDLGPGGPWVTRWGADPLSAEPVDRIHSGPLVDPALVKRAGEQVPLAYMPIALEGTSEAKTAAVGAGPQEPTDYLAVALQTYVPRFDPQAELWYADVFLQTDPMPMPRLRLGLVRYQPNAREDSVPPEGEEPVRLRVSTPVKEWIRPLPGRRAEVTCVADPDGRTRVEVIVTGASGAPGRKRDEPGPGMSVEIVRHREATWDQPALEELARDVDGHYAECSQWAVLDASFRNHEADLRTGVIQPLPGGSGWSWTSLFVLQGGLDDNGWRHAVVVRETERMKSAKGEGRDLDESGPRFAARIELRDPH